MAGPRKSDLKDLVFQPGVMTNATARAAKSKWKDSDRVRWHKGFAEKIKGWIRLALTGANGGIYLGVCRALHDWASLDKQFWIGLGTHCKLYLVNNGTLYDITPARKTSNLSNPFDTTNGSALITVHDVDHRASVGDYITISDSGVVAGLTLNGGWQITAVLTPDTYQFNAGANANNTLTGVGGMPSITYDIYCGLATNGFLYGYGTGVFQAGAYTPGSGTGHDPVDSSSPVSYGTPRAVGSGVPAAMRIWSIDNWGEDLVGSFTDGEIYWWDKTNGPNSRATLIQEAPTNVQRILVNPENRFLIAIGCSGLDGVPDAMRVRWCSQENFNDWTPNLDNTAGGKRLDYGSRLITGLRSRGQVLIWSDTQLYAMPYIGGSLVFGFQPLGACSIVGPNAAIDVNGTAYFMGFDDFFIYDGTLRPMVCDVWTHVFEDFDRTQAQAVYCFSFIPKNEVVWLYVASDGIRYVTYNYVEECWYYGTLDRTAYHGVSPVMTGYLTNPYGVQNGYMYEHETGLDEGEGTTLTNAMRWHLESWDIGQASDKFMLLNQLVPDFERLLVGMQCFIKYKYNPQDTDYVVDGPYDIDPGTLRIDPRARGSQIAIRLQNAADTAGGDPLFGYVSLLCHFDGDDGTNTCIDSSVYAHGMNMAYGGQNGVAQKKFGVSSFYTGPGGGGARVNYPVIQPEFQIQPGKDFTIEAFVWAPNISGIVSWCIFSLTNAPFAGLEIAVEIGSGLVVVYVRQQDATPILTLHSVAVVADGAWHHVALVRSGNDYTLYVDGVRQATANSGAPVMVTYTQLCIGMAFIAEGNNDIRGGCYIDELRYTNGAARYTGATFTVPTSAFLALPFTNISLLMHMEGINGGTTFTDSSSFANPFAVQFSGPTTSSAQKKFGSTSMRGGFGTGGGWLRAPMSASLQLSANLNYTIEGWFYINGVSTLGNPIIMSVYPTGQAMLNLRVGTPPGSKLAFSTTNSVGGTPVVLTGTTVVTPGGWHHFAVVRNATNFYLFLDGNLEATAGAAMVYDANPNFFDIGADQASVIPFDGYIDEIRFTNGAARYTSNFTPEGPFTDASVGTTGQDFRMGLWQGQATPYGDR